MLIESKIKRFGGTVVKLGDTTYHFYSTDKIAAHVAEVKNADHVDRFLAIPEGYRVYMDERSPESEKKQADLLDAEQAEEVKQTTARKRKPKADEVEQAGDKEAK